MPESHESFIRKCFTLAVQAGQKGNHPFGALLVEDGKTLLISENTVNTDHDCTRHAELNLVSSAFPRFGPAILSRSIIYTSTEPCAMCAGAIYWAGISIVVFGCSAETAGRIMDSELVISCKDIFSKGARRFEVIGPILEDEGMPILERFRDNIMYPSAT
jgi:tRNA(Arg) A34 adenosine deaminase TadA